MKKLVLILTALVFGSVFADVEIPADKSKFLIVVLAGQSNMAGRGELDEESTIAHPRVVKLTEDFQWVPCIDPIHFDKSGAGAGIGKKFAEMLADANPDCTVGVVPTAVGGTSITLWLPGETQVQYDGSIMDLYGNFTNRTFFAMKQGKLTAILWHQGESNCSRGTGYLYQTYFPQFIEALRRDFGEDNRCPFIAGSLFDPTGFFENCQAVCQIDWCSNIEGPGAFVMTRDYYTRKDDNIHYTTETARDFGLRYYEAYSNVVDHLAVDPDYWKTNVWTTAMKEELYKTCGRDLSGVKYVSRGVPADQLQRVEFDKMSEKALDWVFPNGVPYVPQHDAQTACVTFNTNTCTISFYYDNFDHGGEGIAVFSDLVSHSSACKWGSIASLVTNAVFDASFAAYRPYSTYQWFNGMSKLIAVNGMENLNTCETVNMQQMFSNCSSLESLDVSHLDTSAVQDFSSMFKSCRKLTSLDVSGFRTTRANTFANMFNACTSLTGTLDLTHFSLARITSMVSMLTDCPKSPTLEVKVTTDFTSHELCPTCGYDFTNVTPSSTKTGVRVMVK